MEPVPDCTPTAFINALCRFMARRGTPQQIFSDNGGQFVLAKGFAGANVEEHVFQSDEVRSYIAGRGCEVETDYPASALDGRPL